MRTIRRRRRESKTDYKSRFHLLKSEKPRVVVRKTNKYIIVQVVSTDVAQDKVIVQVNSKDLLSKGWPKEKEGSLKSLQAAYLTGYMLAKNPAINGKEAIFDTGLYRTVAGSRIFAVLKGAVDGGIKIAHNEKIFPTEERMNSNEKLKGIVEKVKEKL